MFSVCYSGQNQSGESIDQPDSLTNRNQQVNQPREIMLQSFGAKEITQKISKSKCLIANYEKKNLTKLINLFSIMCKFFLLHLNGLTISLTIKYLNWKAEKKTNYDQFCYIFLLPKFFGGFKKKFESNDQLDPFTNQNQQANELREIMQSGFGSKSFTRRKFDYTR